MREKLMSVLVVGTLFGLSFLVAWGMVQPPYTPEEFAEQTELVRANIPESRAVDDETLVTSELHPSTHALPKPQNTLSEDKYEWRQLLTRDGIAPIYDPRFLTAEEAYLDDKELVIGVEINGEAKAYPIGPLNGREMVNDVVGGIPILVTW